MPTLIADYREQKSGVIQALELLTQKKVEVQSLPAGDYRIGDLLFERKTLRDFAVSIQDGRLFRQAIRLAAGPEKGIIILEGSSADLRGTQMPREKLQGALITLSLVLGLPVLRALSPEETARLMLLASAQTERIDRKPIPKKGKRISGKEKWQVEVLQSFPGIGPDKAMRLIERFGSLRGVFSAGAESWQEVRGIGSGLAEKMEWILREEGEEEFPL